MLTTLYEKVFIDGFHKPSYVVATLALARPLDPIALTRAIVSTLERHPRLRSLTREWLGVPVALVPRPAEEWPARGGLRVLESADLHALEERLLGTPLDLRSAMPLEVHLVGDPLALVVKVHHAVIDATSGFALLHDFVGIVDGVTPAPRRPRAALSRARRALDWVARAQLRPRVPDVSVTASYQPAHALEHEPVTYTERVIRGAHPRMVHSARLRGATFFELVASALLSAMSDYNTTRASSPPRDVGLMFARARPRSRQGDVSFGADTCVVSMPAARLAVPHHPATLAELRRAARDPRHNDLALAALYATRKVQGRAREPKAQTALGFTLSDLTAFGRTTKRPSGALRATDVRVLASPTSFDHAGMLVSRFGDDLRLALVAHRGAVDADALLSSTLEHLEES